MTASTMQDGFRRATSSAAAVPEPVLDAALVAAIVEEAPDGLLIVDDTGRMVLANRRIEEIFGYDRGELLGQPVEVLVPEEARSAHAAYRTRFGVAAATRPMGIGLQLAGRYRDGTSIPVEISLSPVDTPSGRFTVAVVRDIAQRLRAEEELRAAREELALLEERERIARDLHDTVVQRIFATGLALQAAAPRMSSDLRERIETAIVALDDTIRDIRTAIFSLHRAPSPGTLRESVLAVTTEAARVLGFAPAVRFAGPVEAGTPPEIGDGLLAVLREALSNVARHAGASRVDVEVAVTDIVTLRVTDDGAGLPAGARRRGGRGLANMEERARVLGGACRITAGPAGGTVVDWQVPVTPA